MKTYRIKNKKSGFTMFFAVLVATLALAVGLAIYSLTARELDLSSVATQSLYAVYAADTGIECAQYWDLKYNCHDDGTGTQVCQSAFATSSASSVPNAGSGVKCDSQDIIATRVYPPSPPSGNPAPTAATTTFSVSFTGVPYCATVSVAKYFDSTGVQRTTISSYGYNTCASSQTRVERLLQANY